ncbi:hypothetical protein ACIQ7D_37415 [Streptomyces sp. NPDC096310]|uniref:hypothetical protein n=1 Tax=Streptomyces sp. NPDC096310 TaxID=3366082 RepID=UPI0038114E3D
MTDSTPDVTELKEGNRIPWGARLRLRRALNRGRTGVLLGAEIREPPRSMSPNWSTVWIKKDGESLAACSKIERLPKFVDLTPGSHELIFIVTRTRKGGTSFTKTVTLHPGEILVALCEPIQPNVFYKKSPAADTWKFGVFSNNGC